MTKQAQLTLLTNQWRDCTKCAIGHYSYKHVFGRGNPLAKIMLIGEAPGKTEDYFGKPFVGASGQLLDEALRGAGLPPEMVYITNTVSCRPCDSPSGGNREPSDTEIKNCSDRLYGTIMIVKPVLIVAVGSVADMTLRLYKKSTFVMPRLVKIHHPAWVLRHGGVNRSGTAFKAYVDEIKEVIRKWFTISTPTA